MNQFKRANVIMLPTNNNLEFPYVAQNVFNKQLTIVNSTFAINCELQNQHLYIISDDQIKEGDWIYENNYNTISKAIYNNDILADKFKKIIATTDTSLVLKSCYECSKKLNSGFNCRCKKLPQPSQQFIEKYIESYNKNEVITDVLIDYEDYILQHMFKPQEYKQRIKINPKNNTITIKKLKNNWNREEVINIFKACLQDCDSESGFRYDDFNSWIKENL